MNRMERWSTECTDDSSNKERDKISSFSRIFFLSGPLDLRSLSSYHSLLLWVSKWILFYSDSICLSSIPCSLPVAQSTSLNLFFLCFPSRKKIHSSPTLTHSIVTQKERLHTSLYTVNSKRTCTARERVYFPAVSLLQFSPHVLYLSWEGMPRTHTQVSLDNWLLLLEYSTWYLVFEFYFLPACLFPSSSLISHSHP